MLAVDEATVSFAHDGFFLLGCRYVGEYAPGLADEVYLAFDVVAAAHRVAIVVVGSQEPGTVPCRFLNGIVQPLAERCQFLAVGEVGSGGLQVGGEDGELLHLGQ